MLAGQIVVPINKQRTEKYGIWRYDNLVVDTFFTQLHATFIATDTASIWGTYSERLKIENRIYECICENLPVVPQDTIFFPGDTFRYTETFLPILDRHNSGKNLYFEGSDTIVFSLLLPYFDWDQEQNLIQEHLVNRAINNYNDSNFVVSSRNLRVATEIGSALDTVILNKLVLNIYSQAKDLRLPYRKIIAEDLYKIVTASHNYNIKRDWTYYNMYLSTLNQLDSVDFELSKRLSTQYIDSLRNIQIYEDSIFVLLLQHRAYSHLILNEVQSAITDFKEAIDIHRTKNGVTPLWFNLKWGLSNCFDRLKEYDELLANDIDILNHAANSNSDNLNLAYTKLCYDYLNIKDYENFIHYAQKALSYSNLPDDMKYHLYFDLGTIFWNELNDMSAAEKYLNIWAKISMELESIPETFENYISKRETLTAFYIYNRDYPKAISNEFYNISEIKEILGADCWEYAQSANNLANALRGVGDRKNSLLYSQLSFDLRCSLNARDSLLVSKDALVHSSINLSYFYREENDYDNAKKYASFAILNTDSTQDLRIRALLNAAYIDFETDNREEGFDKFFEARATLSNLEAIYGEAKYYNEELTTLAIMAGFALDYGAYKDAIKYYNAYKKIILKYNLSDQYLFDYYIGVMRSYYLNGNAKLTIKSGLELLKLARNLISNAFIRLDGQHRHIFMDKLVSYLNQACVYLALTPKRESGAILYDILLLKKGILLQADKDFDDFIMSSNNETLISLRNEYVKNHRLINSAQRSTDFDSLLKTNEKIERDLLRISSSIGNFTNGMLVSHSDIKSKLQCKDIAIEFMKIEFANESGTKEIAYYAILLSPENNNPKIIKLPLGLENLDNLQEDIDPAFVYNIVWQPIIPYLKDKKNIFVSCDGILHNIGIENLSNIDGDHISEHFNIYRLSSTRQLLRDNTSEIGTGVCLYGGLDYETAYSDTIARSIDASHLYNNSSSIRDLRSMRELRYGVYYLPNTLEEILNIENIVKSNDVCKLSVFCGPYGTEESVKNSDLTSYAILHFATHGFYWDGETAKRRQYISFLSNNNNSKDSDEALNRSGIILSGANKSLKGNDISLDAEDGILTAKEISFLNLNNVDLVVLSACQTGLGETSDEGVFGLQRGFKLAGTKTLLMSLWKVDDKATQMLMTEFYKNFLNGKSKRESLLAAQKVVRETPGFEDPVYWAGFILLDALN